MRVCEGLYGGVEMKMLLNGGRLCWFGAEKGIRQGYPCFHLLPTWNCGGVGELS